MAANRRALGTRTVSAIGLGCWSIGGPCWRGDEALGYGEVDDAESIRAIHRALEFGIDLFDTADMYGAGHAERVLGRALAERRDEVTLVTKFGYRIDEERRRVTGHIRLPEDVPDACDASLRRLGTDRIDVYLLHLRDLDLHRAEDVFGALERLIDAGKIASYGWSTDDAARAAAAAGNVHCVAIEQSFNVLQGDAATLAVCEERGVASIQRSPFAMGFLLRDPPGRVAPDDVRANFHRDRLSPLLKRAAAVRPLLTAGGRSAVEGALGWLLARSAASLPIPGFRTVAQVEAIAGALERGPLDDASMATIEAVVGTRDLPANPWDLRGQPE